MIDILTGKPKYESVQQCQSDLDEIAEYIDSSVEIDQNFCTMMICAVRYACGRMTYMPDIVQRFITPLLPKLNNNFLDVVNQDFESNLYWGDEQIDKPGWMRFWDKIKDEIKRRKEAGTYFDV